jgi:hypothetical protein
VTGEAPQTDPRVVRQLRSLERSRLAFGLLALVVPSCSSALFERQARRLGALGDHGAVAEATVVGVTQQQSKTFVEYAYRVGAGSYTWSVEQRKAPYQAGESFPVLYLPEDPSFTMPGTDRSKATVEAASNRSFSRKVVGGLFAFFASIVILCELQLRGLRKRGVAELDDPRAYRRRLIGSGVILAPLLALVFGWHVQDALAKREPIWPEVLAAVVALSLIGGVVFYTAREGPAQASARSARILRWVAPIAFGVAALRAIAWLAGWS